MIFTRITLQEVIKEVENNGHYLFFNDPDEEKYLKVLLAMAFATMAKSDSLYFSAENLVSNAKVALEVCRALSVQGGPPEKHFYTSNFFASVLFANVGVIRGILREDQGDEYLVNKNTLQKILPNHTDSILWKHRRQRSIIYLNNNKFTSRTLDLNVVSSAIENSDFSLDVDLNSLSEFDKLIRSTFIIGFLSGVNFERKLVQYYHSADEGGALSNLGYKNVKEFRENFKDFFWGKLYGEAAETLELLKTTENGKYYVSSLFQHV
ncbi:MAG: hypothetical protein CMM54_04645 [Rhodospirillaceae bacterium]|nr:hypothetical protein [Rhodospirillaceae bacterium]